MESGSLPIITIPDGNKSAVNIKNRENEELLINIVKELKQMNSHFSEWDGDENDSD